MAERLFLIIGIAEEYLKLATLPNIREIDNKLEYIPKLSTLYSLVTMGIIETAMIFEIKLPLATTTTLRKKLLIILMAYYSLFTS
ncbi:hypothetical protein [Vibrio fluvialis]|uniref:hypothetical protein n=1 Tax=Vibrio fluvialis TaxID=676 RepID=UPI001E56811C|nr:hypothetical protein [Vibrio fluvialis]